MIKVVIIEDEQNASKRLHKLVAEMMPDAEVVTALTSVRSAVEWLKNNPHPDLIFVDIQLSDGQSFEIFKQVAVSTPLIFTTAYDAHAVHAFKYNSVDYLLKPIKKDEMRNAVDKFYKLHAKPEAEQNPNLAKLLNSLQQPHQFKQRFVIRLGEHMITVETTDIAYFCTENKVNFIYTKHGKRYPGDYTLDQIEELVDPKLFFRINRQFVISYASIAEMFTYTKSRVLIKLNPPTKLDTIVSTERATAFKSWLAGE